MLCVISAPSSKSKLSFPSALHGLCSLNSFFIAIEYPTRYPRFPKPAIRVCGLCHCPRICRPHAALTLLHVAWQSLTWSSSARTEEDTTRRQKKRAEQIPRSRTFERPDPLTTS